MGTEITSTEDRVRECIAEQLALPLERIAPESHLRDDLGADSLDAVEMIMALEEEFCLQIPEEDAEKIQTVQNAIDYVKSRTTKKE